MNIKELLNYAVNMLREKQVEEPIIKARLLLCYVLKQSRQYLLTHDLEELNNDIINEYMHCINLIIDNVPLQYITNLQEFMKLNFYVDENVLIPRADTEVLVEEVLELCKAIKKPQILDLCTGSGAIAVSLKKYVKEAKIYASDISLKALEIAKKNAKTNNTNVLFLQSDLFCDVNTKFDIIVSNPPYIRREVISILDKQVQNEPILALDGGIEGLDFYKKIINEAYQFLNDRGYLCLEIGYDQREAVIDLIEKQNKYMEIYSKKDLNNNDRIVICRKE